jgi:hypothetical protein
MLVEQELKTRIDEVPNSIIFMLFLGKVVFNIRSIVRNSLLDSLMWERSQLFYSNDSNILNSLIFTSLLA